MDLLTAVMHELGHMLGDDDLLVANHPHDLMAETIPTGVRRLPGRAASAAPETMSAAAQRPGFPIVIGTVPGDKSVAVSSGGILAQPVASASTTTRAVSTPVKGIGGLALFDVTMLGSVLAGLAMHRRRAA